MTEVSSVSLNTRLASLPQLNKKGTFLRIGHAKHDTEMFMVDPAAGVPLTMTRKKFEVPFTRRLLWTQTSPAVTWRTPNTLSRSDSEMVKYTRWTSRPANRSVLVEVMFSLISATAALFDLLICEDGAVVAVDYDSVVKVYRKTKSASIIGPNALPLSRHRCSTSESDPNRKSALQ